VIVVDASVVAAALMSQSAEGNWSEDLLTSEQLAAPALLPAEVANVLRRAARAGDVSSDVASLGHALLLELEIELFPYRPVAERIWELRENLSSYDAWYVALAEALDAPLATLDGRLRRAPGIRCEVVSPGRRPSA
jgi:predicted nucleic acid-binding protein